MTCFKSEKHGSGEWLYFLTTEWERTNHACPEYQGVWREARHGSVNLLQFLSVYKRFKQGRPGAANPDTSPLTITRGSLDRTHSSVLAWRIPGTREPGGLLSMGVAQSRTRLKRLSSSSSSLDRSPFIGPRRGIPNLVFFYKDRHENWACPNPSTM